MTVLRRGIVGSGLLLLALAAAVAIGYFRTAPSAWLPPETRVLLVTVDTLRPDALGFVAGRNDTPVIDALAASGVRFAAAVAPVPLTLPSHATILTGVWPLRHGVRVNGEALAPSIPTLAEQFRAHGHATAAFVSAAVLNKEFGLDRGFDVYDDEAEPIDQRLMQRRAADTFAAARAWIARQGDKPWFVWVHVYDAHTPYDPPRAFWQPGGERAVYDGAVSYIDNALGPLFEDARQAAPGRLLTVLTADHGEAFGEHGEIEHGIFIYDTTMRVPLVFSYPGVLPAAGPAFVPRLVDLAPTLAAGFGWEPSLDHDGIDLGPGLRGRPLEVPPAYIESEYPWTSFGWAPLHGVVDGDWKLIIAPEPELYALASDPGEQDNRFGRNLPQESKLIAWADRTRLADPIAESVSVADAATLSRLQSLGYVGAGNDLGEAPEGRPDPKRTTDLRVRLRDAESLSRRGDIAQARELFREVLAVEPDNRFALARLASIAIDQGEIDAAIDHARTTLAVSPGQADMQFVMADALTRARRYKEALPYWLEAVRLQPSRTEAWSNLGSTAIWAGDYERAISAYREALARAPDDAALLGNLGEAERLAGDSSAAVAHLIAAATREGATTRRAARIGLLLAALDRESAAREWFARATPADDDFAAAKLREAEYLVGTDLAAARSALSLACAADPRIAAALEVHPALRTLAGACASQP